MYRRSAGASTDSWPDLLAALNGVGQDRLIGILKLRAGGKTPSKAADAHAQAGQFLAEVEAGAVTLDGGVEPENDLLDTDAAWVESGGGDALEQAVDGELGGADAFERAEAAHEDVVEAAEHAGLFEGDEVLGLFDDQNEAAIAGVIGAEVAPGRIAGAVGEVGADDAVAYAGLEVGDGVCEGEGVMRGELEQVEGDALGTPPANTGKLGKLFHKAINGAGICRSAAC